MYHCFIYYHLYIYHIYIYSYDPMISPFPISMMPINNPRKYHSIAHNYHDIPKIFMISPLIPMISMNSQPKHQIFPMEKGAPSRSPRSRSRCKPRCGASRKRGKEKKQGVIYGFESVFLSSLSSFFLFLLKMCRTIDYRYVCMFCFSMLFCIV